MAEQLGRHKRDTQKMNGNGRPSAGSVDLSPGSTTVAFDRIIPPQRIPMPAGSEDDPSKGRWVLGFADDDSWRRGLETCHTNVFKQCEMGARMGCSIRASNACRISWWKQILVYLKLEKLKDGEREACEEREMTACLTATKETCIRFSRDTCDPVYADARIAAEHVLLDPRFKLRSHSRTSQRNSMKWTYKPQSTDIREPDGVEGNDSSEECEDRRTTNYRGRRHMSDQSASSWVGPSWNGSSVEEDIRSNAAANPVDGWEGGLIRPKLGSRDVGGRVEECN